MEYRLAVGARRKLVFVAATFVSLTAATSAFAQTFIAEGTNLSADVSPQNGDIAFDLLGAIWLLPVDGGHARELTNVVKPARSPRWSPSGSYLLYESADAYGSTTWLFDIESQQQRALVRSSASRQYAAWHPSEERVVYSAPRPTSSVDLWEIDLQTDLRWRLSHAQGNEIDAAWSPNGKNLAYVRQDDHGWSLILRQHGQAEIILDQNSAELRVPAWRPDGSLLTYLSKNQQGFELKIAILSDPPVVRIYSQRERDFFLSPVTWIDRQRMVYTADGKLLTRRFDDRRAQPILFRATLRYSDATANRETSKRELSVVQAPDERFVIRASRIFDGLGGNYRERVDIEIYKGRIVSVGPRKEWTSANVLDLGDVTVLPGLVDVFSTLPKHPEATSGAKLLAYGVTTLVSEESVGSLDPAIWSGEEFPGPRIIRAAGIADSEQDYVPEERPFIAVVPAGGMQTGRRDAARWRELGVPILASDWTVGLNLGAELLLGTESLPASPLGVKYQDLVTISRSGPITLVSALADAGTPGVMALVNSRQAKAFGHNAERMRRYNATPSVLNGANSVVVGSKPNGLPAGMALHAELRALAAAGLDGKSVLLAAGRNAANVLGVERQIGVISTGALADLVIVAGDPVANVADTLEIVAVVRNGRLFSLLSLLERGRSPADVE